MRLNWMGDLILAFCVSMVSGQSRKIVRYSPAPDVIYYGEVRGNTIHQLRNDIGEIAEGKYAFTGTKHALDAVRLLPPVVPSKIICFGWTFPSHAKEVGGEAHRKEPLVFLKPPTVLIADKDTIILPKDLSEQVEFEGELAVVIGKRSRNLDAEEAMGAVIAVAGFNDVSARDLTKKDPEFTVYDNKTLSDTFEQVYYESLSLLQFRNIAQCPHHPQRKAVIFPLSNSASVKKPLPRTLPGLHAAFKAV